MDMGTMARILCESWEAGYFARMQAGCTPRDGEPSPRGWRNYLLCNPERYRLSLHPYARDRPPW